MAITIRADFWDRPLRHPQLASRLEDAAVTVSPLAADELEAAIVEPVQRQGAMYEPGLVARIIGDVGDQPGALPLLQYALTELFDANISGLIRAESYDAIGGLTGALSSRAEQTLVAMNESQQLTARRLFGRLVTLGEGTEDTRRRVRLAELGDEPDVAAVIDTFGAARMLVFDRDPATREPTVEIAHEALLRAWPRLHTWLDDDRDDLRTLRNISTATDAWLASDRDHGELARSGRLDTVTELAQRRPDLLNNSETEWITASGTAADAESEAQAQAAARDRQQNRRLRQLLGAAAVLVVIAVIAAGGAVVLRNRSVDSEQAAVAARSEAEANAQQAADSEQAAVAAQSEAEANAQQALDAEQRALAAQENAEIERLSALSAAQVTVAPDVAILLALEANRRRDDVGTQSAVQQAIATQPGLIDVFSNPLDGPSYAVFSRDANVGVAWTIAAGGAAVQFFDSKSGELLGDSHETDAGIQWVTVSDDGKLAAVALLDRTIRFINADGDDVAPPFDLGDVRVLNLNRSSANIGPLENISLDRTGDRLLLSSAFFVQVIDVSTGAVVLTYEPFDDTDAPNLIDLVGELSSDGSLFVAEWALTRPPELGLPSFTTAAAGYDIVDASTGELRERVTTDEISAIDLSPTDRLVLGYRDGSVEFRDIGGGDPAVALSGLAGQIIAVGTGRDGSVAAVQGDGTMRLWSTDGSVASTPFSIGGGVIDVAFGTDGAASVSLAASGFMRFDPSASVMVDQVRRRPQVFNVFAGHGYYESLSADLSMARLRSLSTDEVVSETPLEEAIPYGVGGDLFYSSDGRWSLLWPAQLTDPLIVLTVPWGDAREVDVSGALADAGLAPLDSLNSELSMRPASDGQRLILVRSDPLTGNGEAVWIDAATSAVLFGPIELDGWGIPFVLADGRVVVGWDTSDLKILPADFDGPPIVVDGASGFRVFDIDDHTGLVLIGATSGQVGLLDVDTATVRYLEDAGDVLKAGAFSHDGRRLVVYSEADGIQVVDVATGRRIGLPMSVDDFELTNVTRITWDEDDTGVWMTTTEGLIRFAADAAAWRETACGIVHRELSPEEWNTLVSDTEPQVSACT